MTGPFPDWVEIPPGLTARRLPLGMPVAMGLTIGALLAAPLYFLGKMGVLVLPLVVPIAWWLRAQCKRDPDFLSAWKSEMQFKRFYH